MPVHADASGAAVSPIVSIPRHLGPYETAYDVRHGYEQGASGPAEARQFPERLPAAWARRRDEER